jgi:hypothetical protein
MKGRDETYTMWPSLLILSPCALTTSAHWDNAESESLPPALHNGGNGSLPDFSTHDTGAVARKCSTVTPPATQTRHSHINRNAFFNMLYIDQLILLNLIIRTQQIALWSSFVVPPGWAREDPMWWERK